MLAGAPLKTNLSGVEAEVYQVKNQSSQDPLNFPIKLNNKLASLNGVVSSAPGAPTAQAVQVFNELSAKLGVQTGKMRTLYASDLAKFNELLKKYKNKGLVIVGVCTSNRGQEKMEQTASARGIAYPTARDPQLTSQKAWQVHYYPTYAIVDRKGTVRIVGLKPNYVEQAVKKLLAEAPGA